MYRLLIVDDEEMIAESMYNYIRESFESELEVYKAYSAFEAMKLLRRMRFEIVMTDISMPGMDGLTLLDNIKRFWPLCRVIILTGYADFEYAYRVLKYAGVSYLLKTEEYEKIGKTVMLQITTLDEELHNEEMVASLGERITCMLPILRRELLGRIIRYGDRMLNAKEIVDVGLDLSSELDVLMAMGRIDISDKLSVLELGKIQQTVAFLFEKAMEKRKLAATVYLDDYEMVWLLQKTERSKDEPPEDLIMYVYESMPVIQERCRQQTGKIISFIASRQFVGWSDIHMAYTRLKSVLECSTGLNRGVILIEAEMDEKSALSAEKYYPEIRDLYRLCNLMHSGQQDEFISELSHGLDYLRRVTDIHRLSLSGSVSGISLIMMEGIRNYGMPELPGKTINDILSCYGFTSGEDWIESVIMLTRKLFDQRESSKTKNTAWAVECIKDYVNENYMKELSLSGLTELVHFNPSYLSRLFKEVTGTNLLEYVNNVRITRAKALLDGTSLLISEIAEKTGFLTSKYFTFVFKKAVGVTPTVYRELPKTENRN